MRFLSFLTINGSAQYLDHFKSLKNLLIAKSDTIEFLLWKPQYNNPYPFSGTLFFGALKYRFNRAYCKFSATYAGQSRHILE